MPGGRYLVYSSLDCAGSILTDFQVPCHIASCHFASPLYNQICNFEHTLMHFEDQWGL